MAKKKISKTLEPASDLLNRFRDPNVLREALLNQRIVEHDKDIANEFANVVELREYADGETLIMQNGFDNHLFFILTEEVVVKASGHEVAVRKADNVIGETTLVDIRAKRSADVFARGRVVVARISEPDFRAVADRHHSVWKLLAIELAGRLRERNISMSPPNARPNLFIGTSTEALPIGEAIKSEFANKNVSVKLWPEIFLPGQYTIEALMEQAKKSDFAVLVFSPDDKVISRKKQSLVTRDNVLLELGLFMGSLGRERAMILLPREAHLKVPSDLLGLTRITYELGPAAQVAERLADACEKVRDAIKRLGCKLR